MSGKVLCTAVITLAAITIAGRSESQPASPSFNGTYRCNPEPMPCQAGGQTFTVTQSGNNLDFKNDRGDVGRGTVTSNISLGVGAPWNMLGVILPDGRIQWSNGTIWQKQ